MAAPQNILHKLIYLDSDYVSSVYETVANESPKTYFSKTQGKKSDGSNDEIFVADVQSNGTREFTKSSLEMLKTVYEELEKQPDFKPSEFKNYKGTQTVWFGGDFTMGEWKHSKITGGEERESQTHIVYEIKADDFSYALLAQTQLFSSNIGSLIAASPTIRRFIGIPAKALGRVLYFLEDANMFVVTPYLIVEAEKS